jgi:O-antigen/teichoic acid export membrane protein
MIKNKQVFSNTLFLYVRQLIIIGVSFYTIRIVLDVLGINDFGIFSLIASIISIGVFINATMASSTQRYFSFALGKGDNTLLSTTFCVNVTIYTTIAFVAFIFFETIGLWVVKNYVQLPDAKFDQAISLYHWSVFTFVFTLLTVPFSAIIIAHEDMRQYAMFAIIEALLRLVVVFALSVLDYDKLVLYGALLFGVSVVTFLMHILFCIAKYAECKMKRWLWDKQLVVQIFKFTGWTLFGQMSFVARTHGVTILLNQFFSPATIAARAIALNVATQTGIFAGKFNIGLYPPIIKSYASEDREELFNLLYFGSKLTFFLMWVMTLPLLIELETVMQFLLVDVPVETYLFTRLALIEVLLLSVSLPLATAARAPGDVKEYELTLGSIQFLILLISYWCLSAGWNAQSVYWVAILAHIIMFWVRLRIVSKLINMQSTAFISKVIKPLLLVVLVSASLSYWANLIIEIEHYLLRSIVVMVFSIVISSLCMFTWGLEKIWRDKVYLLVREKLIAQYSSM